MPCLHQDLTRQLTQLHEASNNPTHGGDFVHKIRIQSAQLELLFDAAFFSSLIRHLSSWVDWIQLIRAKRMGFAHKP